MQGEGGAVRGSEAGSAEQAERQHRACPRRSCSTNPARSARPAAYAPPVEPDVQPASLPRVVAHTIPNRPALASTRPGRSSGAGTPRLSARRRGGECRDGETERDVDPEDPVPAERLDEHTAEQRAERHAEPGDRRPEAEREAPPLRREGRREQGQREGHQQRGADALDGPCGHELGHAVRERARRGGPGEEQQAEHEHAPAAEAVTERGARQHQHREREDVRVDGPLQAVDRHVQVELHRGQRRQHDQVVEGDHQERDAGQGDRPDLARAGIHEAPIMYDGCRTKVRRSSYMLYDVCQTIR